jgi:RecT family
VTEGATETQSGGRQQSLPLATVPAQAGLAERGAWALAPDRVEVVRKLFASGRDQLTDPEIAYVLSEAARTRLDPIRQMAAWRDKFSGKIVIHTRIDGLLAIAERTGQYRGSVPTLLTWRVGENTFVRPMREGSPGGDAQLLAATCAVRRDGYPDPVEVTRYWADMAPKEIVPNSSWDRQGAVMLEKTALAAALRRAFPQDLADLYEESELPDERGRE